MPRWFIRYYLTTKDNQILCDHERQTKTEVKQQHKQLAKGGVWGEITPVYQALFDRERQKQKKKWQQHKQLARRGGRDRGVGERELELKTLIIFS